MTKYEDIIKMAPNPDLADKIMCASYILAKGQPNVEINHADIMRLISTMNLEELKRNADKIKEEKRKRQTI